MKNAHLMRQLAIIPMDILETPITIIGAGAIGSHTAMALAKMGFQSISVWDDDIVSVENMNSQGYPKSTIDRKKVEALAELIEEWTGIDIEPIDARYGVDKEMTGEGMFNGIVISAVDNMATRRLIWENHKGKAVGTQAIIDPRMGAEMGLLYTMHPLDPKDQEAYEKVLYDDLVALPDPCTAKATIYTALLMAGMVCKAVKDELTQHTVYPRVLNWNIRDNAMQSWGSRKPMEEPPLPTPEGPSQALETPIEAPEAPVPERSDGVPLEVAHG